MHIVVVADDGAHGAALITHAVDRIEALEARWSRFRPSSEISRLNRLRGAPVRVSHDTYELVTRALSACDATGGRYDPTVHDAMVQLGYDRDFKECTAMDHPERGASVPAGGAHGIRCDPYLPAVTLPADVGFDPGGIGKGLAADIVVRELLDAGAAGALVNLGGDVVAAGMPPDEHGWIVGIEDPLERRAHVGRVTVVAAAVCTSSARRRSWRIGDRSVHHLLDPRTGEPVDSEIASVTVVAGAGWRGEALTKALFVAGARRASDQRDTGTVLARMEALVGDEHVLVVLGDGATHVLGEPGVFDLESDAL